MNRPVISHEGQVVKLGGGGYPPLWDDDTKGGYPLAGCCLHEKGDTPGPLCMRLARGKFELTNQDSASGKILTGLTSMKVNRTGIEIKELFSL